MRYLDAAIREQLFAAVQPARLETLLTALTRLEQERQALDHQWHLKLERARYAVRLAQRQYDACDPDNRLVARALETRWNDALAVEGLGSFAAPSQRTRSAQPGRTGGRGRLAADLPAVWEA
jgi:hypothetical protein